MGSVPNLASEEQGQLLEVLRDRERQQAGGSARVAGGEARWGALFKRAGAHPSARSVDW